MIPEPITVARSRAVPTASATARRASVADCWDFTTSFGGWPTGAQQAAGLPRPPP